VTQLTESAVLVPAAIAAVRARKQAEQVRFLRIYKADYGRGYQIMKIR
jgi:hypothetical protein